MLSRKDKIAAIVDNRRRNGELFKQFINWLTNLDNGLLNCKNLKILKSPVNLKRRN